MDVRAILLTGIPYESASAATQKSNSPESFSGTPLALLPVLGRPVVHRVADRLKASGVDCISVLDASNSASTLTETPSDSRWKNVSSDRVWQVAEEEFESQVQAGAELVIVVRLGAYAEVEIDPLIQFHLDQRNCVTQVKAADGLLDFFVLSASRRNDAAHLLRHKLGNTRASTATFEAAGYVNRLRTPADLRALAFDSLMQKTSIHPVGSEVKPGVWIASGARVHRSARLVAPCYVGTASKVRAGSLITRGSSIEHHCVVDCGSVIESSTVLPLSYLGKGLDLTHSLLGSRRIFSVKYGAEMDVEDVTLVSILPSTSVRRTLQDAASLVAFIPRQIVRSVFGEPKQRESQVDSTCPSSGTFEPASVVPPVNQRTMPSSVVAGVREYGNQ